MIKNYKIETSYLQVIVDLSTNCLQWTNFIKKIIYFIKKLKSQYFLPISKFTSTRNYRDEKCYNTC